MPTFWTPAETALRLPGLLDEVNGLPADALPAATAERVQAWRRLLASDAAEAAAIVNRWLVGTGAGLRASRSGQLELQCQHSNADPVAGLEAQLFAAVAGLLVRGDWHRVRTCARPDCSGIFYDASRNQGRRYCSRACGNRSTAAAYRERHRRLPSG